MARSVPDPFPFLKVGSGNETIESLVLQLHVHIMHIHIQIHVMYMHTPRARDHVQQPDNFRLNIAFVSTNITLNGHDVLTNSSIAVAVIILGHMCSTL